MLSKPPKGRYKLFKGLTCAPCSLNCPDDPRNYGKGFSLPNGTGENGVLGLAEGLGNDEVVKGRPLVGRSGFMRNRICRLLQEIHGDEAKPESFAWWNTVACQPPKNRTPTEEEVAFCDPYFIRVLDKYRPKVIMPMGKAALWKLLRIKGILDLPKIRAPKRGYVWEKEFDLPSGPLKCHIVPVVHPAYLLRGQQRLIWTSVQDFHKALVIAKDGYKTYKPNRYVLHPSVTDANIFYGQAKRACPNGAWLSSDIETDWSASVSEDTYSDLKDEDILRVSFSYRPGEAITVPFISQFIPFIQKMYALKWEWITFWNYLFDAPRLKAHGIKLPWDRIIDLMWGVHWYQSDVPKGLGFWGSILSPLEEWKSEGDIRPEFYSCADADAPSHIGDALYDILQEEGRWDAFLREWREPEAIFLHMGRGEHSGLTLDIPQRDKLEEEYTERQKGVRDKLQTMIPEDAKPLLVRKVLKEKAKCPRCLAKGLDPDLKKLRKTHKVTLGNIAEFFERKGRRPSYFLNRRCQKCNGRKMVNVLVKPMLGVEKDGWLGTRTSWVRRDLFNAGSPDQIKAYCHYMEDRARAEGDKVIAKAYKVPMYQGRETTDELSMKQLRKRTEDPIFDLLLEGSKYDTVLERYIPKFLWELGDRKQKFIIDEDGRVRTTIQPMASTWREQPRDPNIAQIPKRPNEWISKEMLQDFRRQFKARPGWEIGQVDWRGAEAVATGWVAGDEELVEICQEYNLHAFLATEVLSRQGKFKEGLDVGKHTYKFIWDAIRWIKEDHTQLYDQCKCTDFLSFYGGTPLKILLEHPENFKTQAEAAAIQEILWEKYARKVREWQDYTMGLVRDHHFLDNVFKGRHHFWTDYRWDHKKQREVWGTDAKRILAFLPQSMIACLLRKSVVKMGKTKMRDYLRWPIHDQLLSEYPKGKRKHVLGTMVRIMQEPIEEMGGLRLGTEVEAGVNWGDVKEVRV